MNENEMNVQNVGNTQPINPNVSVPPEPNNGNIGGMTNPILQNMVMQQQPEQVMQNGVETREQINSNIGVVQNPIPQNVVETEPVNHGNVEVIAQPSNNFMEDFSQAVVQEPVTPIVNVSSTMNAETTTEPISNPTPSNVSVDSQIAPSTPVMTPSHESAEVVSAPSNNSMATPISTVASPAASDPQPIQTEAEIPNSSNPAVATARETVTDGKTGKKKKGNWAFIIALFAVVGFFVLLLPLLVRIFGY